MAERDMLVGTGLTICSKAWLSSSLRLFDCSLAIGDAGCWFGGVVAAYTKTRQQANMDATGCR
jgi:hypothetical protein